ncbi:hypothetical protein [Alkalimarinus alittae]|uniref:Uncharacterized protein n=1 Tax=Alkalimarinus alittae TaxID=2961619 RepID=A0ABY6N6S6_9ALTE|nr:hypothetical protein [Alkalimarinus alittae]UZE97828.1 hypothetical protein NKI27_08870 [Alkalimarinus alittae]
MFIKNNKLFKVTIALLLSIQINVVNAEEVLKLEITEETKATALNNMNYLMAQSLVKAKEKLSKDGKFYPFGAALFGGGKVRYVWADVGVEPEKLPSPALALPAIRKTLHVNAVNEQIVASAVYYILEDEKSDGTIQSKIVVELEHLPGVAVARAIEFETVNGVIMYGRAGEQEYSPKVFFKSDLVLDAGSKTEK